MVTPASKQSSLLIGRNELSRQCEQALRGTGSVLVLAGDAGVGKTSIWSEILRRTKRRLIVASTCYEAESSLGWVAAANLVTALGKNAPPEQITALSPGLRLACRALISQDWSDQQPGVLDPRIVGALLLVLTSTVGGVIAIDDLQWCDAESYQAICYALRRSGARGASWLAARRPDPDRVLPHEQLVVVPPLAIDELRLLLRSMLGVALPPMVLGELARVSGGNPLHALEIARTLGSRPSPQHVQRSPGLRNLVERRLRALPQATLNALTEVAVLNEVTADWAQLPDLSPAFDAGVLVAGADGTAAFSHPLLSAGCIALASPAVLVRAHRRAVDHTQSPVARARHLAAATTRASEKVACELDAAAELSSRHGDRASAVHLSARALEIGRSPAPWDRLGAAVRFGTAAYDERTPGWAEELVVSSRPGPQQAQALLLAGSAQSDATVRLSYGEQALAQPDLDDDLRMEILADLSISLVVLGRHAEAADLLQPHARTSRSLQSWPRLVASLAQAQRIAGREVDLDLLSDAVEVARQDGRSHTPLITFGLIAMWDDRHEQAQSAFMEAIAMQTFEAALEGQFHLAELHIRCGRLTEAIAISRSQAVNDEGQDHAAALWPLAYALAWAGDETASRQAAEECQASSRDSADELFWVAAGSALGLLELTLQRFEAAWQVLSASAAALEHQQFEEPSCFPVLPLAIEASLQLGRLDEAVRWTEMLDRQARQLSSRWAIAAVIRAGAQFESVRGNLDAAMDGYAAAASSYAGLGLPLERARTLLLRGELARRSNQRKLAQLDLTEALSIFKRHRCLLLVARSQNALARLGGRVSESGDLTPAERAAAELVASGMTNLEVARQLSISVKTVEAHLSRAFHKLQVRSRVQLANLLNGD